MLTNSFTLLHDARMAFQREYVQLSLDVLASTQHEFKTKKYCEPALLGLSDTVLSEEWQHATDSTDMQEFGEDSKVSPGSFTTVPIVDQTFSSDSSYAQTHRRDVGYSFDTVTSPSATEATPEGYRAAQRNYQLERIDHPLLFGQLNGEFYCSAHASIPVTSNHG